MAGAEDAGGGITMPLHALVELFGARELFLLREPWRQEHTRQQNAADGPDRDSRTKVGGLKNPHGGDQSRSKSRIGFSIGPLLAFLSPSANLRSNTSSLFFSACTDNRNFFSNRSFCSRSNRAVSSKVMPVGGRGGGTWERTTPRSGSMVSLASQQGQGITKVRGSMGGSLRQFRQATTERKKRPSLPWWGEWGARKTEKTKPRESRPELAFRSWPFPGSAVDPDAV